MQPLPWARLACVAAFSLLCACSITRNVRPVGAGQGALGVSLGGPFFGNLGVSVPMPLIAVTGRYGLTDATDVDMAVHAPVARATGIDAGVAHLFLAQDGGIPAVMAGVRLLLFANGRAFTGKIDPSRQKPYSLEARLFEEVYGTASWQVHPSWLVYGGLDLFAQLEHGVLHPSLSGGAQWLLTRTFSIAAEVRWMAFLSDQSHLVVKYGGTGGMGAWGLQLGATYTFSQKEAS